MFLTYVLEVLHVLIAIGLSDLLFFHQVWSQPGPCYPSIHGRGPNKQETEGDQPQGGLHIVTIIIIIVASIIMIIMIKEISLKEVSLIVIIITSIITTIVASIIILAGG